MGGAQRYVFDLATNLDKNRYEILAAIGNDAETLSKILGNQGYRVFKVRNLVRNIHPLKDFLAIWELKKLIRELDPDIVHLNSSKAGVIGSFAGWLAGKPVLFTAHGFAFLEPNSFLVRQIYFWAEKLASIFRNKIITVSEFDRKSAIADKLSKQEKLVTIHNGIATSPGLTTTLPTPGEGKITIGTIAHDYPTKDLKTLRAAFKIVEADFPNAQLKIVSGVSDAAQLLPTFDIYACSSIKEGFPYTILEAMRAGLPIVSTNVGGVPEMLTPHLTSPTGGEETAVGILVPPKNPQALAEAVIKILSDPILARRLGENAKQKSLQFTLARMIEKTENVYQELIYHAN